jgi:hypothetical protein
MAMAEAWHGIEAWAAAVRPPPTVTPRIANQPTCSQFVTGRHAAVFGIAEADWGANPAAASQSDPADKF